jgi:hypothetical protein
LLGWWGFSGAAWLGLGIAAETVLSPVLAFLAGAAIWGLATIFVVPLLAIDGGGPLAALGNGLALLRKRWGRALIGVALLAGLFFVLAIPAGLVLSAGVDRYRLDPDAGTRIYFGGIALFYLTYLAMMTVREGFALILARDALGDLPGEPAAAKPRRRGWVIAGRIVLGLVCLLVLLGILGAILRDHEPNASGSSAAPSSGVRFYTTFTDPRAQRIEVGAPVELEATRIGTVYDTTLVAEAGKPAVMQVRYLLERAWFRRTSGYRLILAERGGYAYLLYRKRR